MCLCNVHVGLLGDVDSHGNLALAFGGANASMHIRLGGHTHVVMSGGHKAYERYGVQWIADVKDPAIVERAVARF